MKMTHAVDLGEGHYLAVTYSNNLEPTKLKETLGSLGDVSSFSTYVLVNEDLLSVVAFSDPTHTTVAHRTIQSAVAAGHPVLRGVAWINEERSGAAHLKEKSYVAREYVSADDACGYLIIFWKPFTAIERESIRACAKQFSLEDFSDEKEGGRCFLKLKDDDMAEECRLALVSKYPKLYHDVSFGSKEEYRLAKKNLS
ncbi:hypothetical protein AGDE_10957 [Angomonas deanei]|uniref:Uncharacterized protein n=1 Tax=Angomonas deanei TaxID=59799 RepID=A0A7G2CF54_9TRYP|nr:hypothetical protein AGDE_10957 [Angomonas deanei]CAD2217657.1 hypothetical protein, conserved [Angomonas deanei]|eukprot:EPY27056.1 hypothetical protein AGDE_10957 [Angomonas deanei]